jgi:hypothetical protein
MRIYRHNAQISILSGFSWQVKGSGFVKIT